MHPRLFLLFFEIIYLISPVNLFTERLTIRASIPKAPVIIATVLNNAKGCNVSRLPATRPAKRFPKAVATNQIPIICPILPAGASLVTEERPTGDSANSPTVKKKYITTNQAGDTGDRLALTAPQAMTKKPVERPSSPSPNLAGMDGLAFRADSQIQREAKIGEKIIIKAELTD